MNKEVEIIKEKIGLAFDTLQRFGYVTIQKAPCCQSCALDQIGDADKYVFYHDMDNLHLISNGVLWLSWGGDIEVICKAINQQGLTVTHDGDENKRIRVILKTN